MRVIIENICKRAMEAELSLEAFYKLWPETANKVIFYKQVYDDLEDAIEHAPGKLFSRGVDFDAWKESREYSLILVDYHLLRNLSDVNKMSILRNEIVESSEGTISESLILSFLYRE